VAGRNKILNGDFYISQRGSSFTNPGYGYTLDRWLANSDGSGSTKIYSQIAFDYSSSPAADKLPISGQTGTYFYRANQTVAGSGGTFSSIEQKIENVQTFANQTVTISFWAKAAATTTLGVSIYQYFGSGGSSTAFGSVTNFSLTTSWVRYSATISVPTIVGKTIGAGSFTSVDFALPVNSTYTIDIWGVQAEAGSVATPFTTATGTLQGELAACQRYYWRSAGQNNGQFGLGIASSTTVAAMQIKLPVTMRTNGTSIDYSALYIADGVNAFTGGTVGISIINPDTATISYTTTGLTQFRTYYLSMTSNSGYIGINAEL
jgi:hypothetical protein